MIKEACDATMFKLVHTVAGLLERNKRTFLEHSKKKRAMRIQKGMSKRHAHSPPQPRQKSSSTRFEPPTKEKT